MDLVAAAARKPVLLTGKVEIRVEILNCLESFPAFLVLSSQSSAGPAGGAPDGYGLGRGAAGPRGATSAARDAGSTAQARLINCSGPGGATLSARDRAAPERPHGPGRSYIDRTGRVTSSRPTGTTSQDVTILVSAHAPPPGPIRARA